MADPQLVDRILGVIRQHESGGNYQALNKSERADIAASGAYQFIASTWQNVARQSGVPEAAQYARAVDAPPAVQDAVARWYVGSILDANGGKPDAVWATWYTGHYDPNHLDYVPSGANTTTVRAYINQANNMLAGGGNTASTAQADASQDPQVQAFLQALAQDPDGLARARFPAYSMYLADPEMGPILRQAAAENWDSTRLTNAVQGTNWWRTTTDAQRQWDSLESIDPASAARQHDQKLLEVSQQFAKIGYVPDQVTLQHITDESLRNGWDSNAITQAILAALPEHYTSDQLGGGDIAGTMTALRAAASDYYMPLTDDTAYDWAKRITAGTLTQSGINGQLANWAKTNFAWAAPTIDAGGTMKDIFSPLQEQVGTIMGTAPGSVDILNDPYWHQLVHMTDANGQTRQPTIQDAQQLARNNPGWKHTADAENRQASITMALQQTFNGGG